MNSKPTPVKRGSPKRVVYTLYVPMQLKWFQDFIEKILMTQPVPLNGLLCDLLLEDAVRAGYGPAIHIKRAKPRNKTKRGKLPPFRWKCIMQLSPELLPLVPYLDKIQRKGFHVWSLLLDRYSAWVTPEQRAEWARHHEPKPKRKKSA